MMRQGSIYLAHLVGTTTIVWMLSMLMWLLMPDSSGALTSLRGTVPLMMCCPVRRVGAGRSAGRADGFRQVERGVDFYSAGDQVVQGMTAGRPDSCLWSSIGGRFDGSDWSTYERGCCPAKVKG